MLFPYARLFFPDPSSFLSWISQLMRCKAAEVSGWADFRPDVSYKLEMCATAAEYKAMPERVKPKKLMIKFSYAQRKESPPLISAGPARPGSSPPFEIRILRNAVRIRRPSSIKSFQASCGSQFPEGSYALSFTRSHQER